MNYSRSDTRKSGPFRHKSRGSGPGQKADTRKRCVRRDPGATLARPASVAVLPQPTLSELRGAARQTHRVLESLRELEWTNSHR